MYNVVDDIEIETPSVKVDVSTNTTLSLGPFIQVNFYTINNDVDVAENIDMDNCSDATVSSNNQSEYKILNTDSSNSDSDFDECESEQNELEGMKVMTLFSSLLLLLKFCLVYGLPAVI